MSKLSCPACAMRPVMFVASHCKCLSSLPPTLIPLVPLMFVINAEASTYFVIFGVELLELFHSSFSKPVVAPAGSS